MPAHRVAPFSILFLIAGVALTLTGFAQPPNPPTAAPIWDPSVPLKNASQLPILRKTRFHVIKQWDQSGDGYTFLHGVGLAWFRGRLFASFGHNQGEENTVTEEAHFRVSSDAGRTWGPLEEIDTGEDANLAVSHGVFLATPTQLWAFHGSYYHKMERIHTRAYRYDDATHAWRRKGKVIGDGFWPMNQPIQLPNGNWIMPGFCGGPYDGNKVFPAAVAISHGSDFEHWDLVSIPVSPEVRRMWGESAIFVDGDHVFNVARFGGQHRALVAVSRDGGRTWSPSAVSNLPMAASKPAAGVLSTGHRYLISNSAAGNGKRRNPLAIAISRPGQNQFSRIAVIRHAENPGHPGESAPNLSLAYPYAIEHEGELYIGYSNNGGRRANLNSAELAVVSIQELID